MPGMDHEIERGRIAGLRVRRLETANWAKGLVPSLDKARESLPDYAGTGEPSRQAYADWLNRKKIPTRNGKGNWGSEQVRRLFDIHISLMDEAENEFDIEIGIIKYKRWINRKAGGELFAEEEKTARENRVKQINEAYRLSAELQGRPYTDQEIPDSLGRIGRVRLVNERVETLRARRIEAVNYARTMISIIQGACDEIGAAASWRAFADWLNERNYKTVKGKVWRAETVSHLLMVDAFLIRQLEAEHQRVIELEKLTFFQDIERGEDEQIASTARDKKILESELNLENIRIEAMEIADEFRSIFGCLISM